MLLLLLLAVKRCRLLDAGVAIRLLLLWGISCTEGPVCFTAEAGASPKSATVLAAAVLLAVAAAVLLKLLQLPGRAVGRVGAGVGVAAAAASILLLLAEAAAVAIWLLLLAVETAILAAAATA